MRKYMNRELSWLKFNERVLEEAENKKVPLCERLNFAAIYQSNLDEFYGACGITRRSDAFEERYP